MRVIRIAEEKDEPAVRRVMGEAFASARKVYRPSEKAMGEWSERVSAMERVVVEEDGEVVGTVCFWVDGELMRVVGLAVLPGMQGKGVGRQLVGELERIGRENGCRALSLYTVLETGNVLVFERMGFEVMEVEVDEYSVGVTGEAVRSARMEKRVG